MIPQNMLLPCRFPHQLRPSVLLLCQASWGLRQWLAASSVCFPFTRTLQSSRQHCRELFQPNLNSAVPRTWSPSSSGWRYILCEITPHDVEHATKQTPIAVFTYLLCNCSHLSCPWQWGTRYLSFNCSCQGWSIQACSRIPARYSTKAAKAFCI